MGKFLVARRMGRGPRRGRPAPPRLRVERLESRQLLATLVVNTAADDTTPDDTLSLREAIELTNGTLASSALSDLEQAQVTGDLSAANTIDFAIPGAFVPVIIPASALPTITRPVTIDGTSQPASGFVAIDGANAGAGVDGLTISAGGSSVKGLIIALYGGSGIRLTGAGGNVVTGCILGTDVASDRGIGNAGDGVFIDGSPNNTIGGTDTVARNILSGNGTYGIAISGAGATGNVVVGNFIGTDVAGMDSLANAGSGVDIAQAAANNLIGGTTTTARNLISGNGQNGILLSGSGPSNRIQGNYLGTDVTGGGLLPNIAAGITITGASGNTIGGSDPGAGNLISSNGEDGVFIFSTTDGTDTAGNTVQGNWIGLAASGTAALGNMFNGVTISNARNNLIGGTAPGAGNVISGNGRDGIQLANGARGNQIQGNKIGTNPGGTQAQPNVEIGVLIVAAPSNIIGGAASGAGNVISGNNTGIKILGSGADNTQILGNLIGTDVTGSLASLANLSQGIFIEGGANETIGGTTPAARNIISSNGADGILIHVSSNIVVQGNYIGTDKSGTTPVSNGDNGITVSASTNVLIGGTATGAGNVISGNAQNGIAVEFTSTGTVIAGNIVGLDSTGTQLIINFGIGVSVDTSSATTIGGTTIAARNIISANGGDGVRISSGSSGALLQGNFIGTDISGTVRLSNIGDGVEVSNLAAGVTIGGTTAAARNVISGNLGNGIVLGTAAGAGNLVQGNFIGTDVSGTQDLGNVAYGVLIQSPGNIIGGATPSTENVVSAEQNVISSNHRAGVLILERFAKANIVEGNLIGTDVSGTRALPNAAGGVAIESAATGNTIGGTTPAARNIISGNLSDGVAITGQGTSGNTVEGNQIGTDVSGLHALGNFLRGIFIQDAANNTIGGTTLSAANLISGNGQDGIAISNLNATGNLIELNGIGTDITIASALGNGGNGIAINNAPRNTIIRNVISSNRGNGISILNLLAAPGQGLTIIANVIGTNLSSVPLGNGGDGILLDNVTNQIIGSPVANSGNYISANQQAGIEIRGAGSSGNVVETNDIGTNIAGTGALANAIGVNINGAPRNTVQFNLISGNSLPQGGGIGVQILGSGATGNLVLSNFIGTDSSGTAALANDIGVFVNGAPGNSIVANLISGNIRPDTSGIGVQISGAGATNNVVASNKIGTDRTGTRTLVTARADLGILITETQGNNLIGGPGAALGNVISGFKVAVEVFASQSEFNPTPGSIIQGNKIGTDLAGKVALGNNVGIYINGVPRNLIGGTTPGAGNIISGNTIGIYLLGTTTKSNQVQGNLIGLDATGKLPLGNYIGVYLDGANGNTIGGTTTGARNVIAGNKRNGADGSTGVYVFNKAVNNLIQNNFIGTTSTGRPGKGLGMGDYGVLFFNAPNNNAVRSGKGKNKILGSGIAAFREFTGRTSSRRAPISGTQAAAMSGSHHVPHGPRRLLSSTVRRHPA